MFACGFCEKEKTETWTGKYCETCRKLKNLCNVYGYLEIYNICQRVCVRNAQQQTNKINIELRKDSDESYIKGSNNKWVKPS
tara:strand:+ start:2511 stop:2756 length:246 start_codon:yes stop_codon:yes gene_type:complete